MRILSQDISEERGAGGEDDFVGGHLAVLAGKGHIKEVFLLPKFPERNADVGFKVVPSQAELLR